jgi:hypothetical protein
MEIEWVMKRGGTVTSHGVNFKKLPAGVGLIQNSLLARYCVIPAQAGIQLIIKSPAKRDKLRSFARFAGCLSGLDSRLRGNDGIMNYLG